MVVKEQCIAWYMLYFQPIHEERICTHVELVNEFHRNLKIIQGFDIDPRPSVFNFLEFLPLRQLEDLYLSNGVHSAEDIVLRAFYNSRICDEHSIFKNEQIFMYGHPFDPMSFAGSPPSLGSLSVPSTPLRHRSIT